MLRLPLFGSGRHRDASAKRPAQPYSARTLEKHSRTRGSDVTHSVCCYCAVGCGTLIYTKDDQILSIEGNPDSPINEGTLCPKGANLYQLHSNPHRVTHVMWRAPYSDRWELKPLRWAIDRIAQLVKKTRDEGYEETTQNGRYFNMGVLGGATLDVEENYLIKKLFGAGLGVLSIENQARI